MTEGGRSIVWKAVETVLKKWSYLGKIGTNKRYKPKKQQPIKSRFDWIEGMPDEDGLLVCWKGSKSNEELHSDLTDGMPEEKRFYNLHQEEIDDIAAEISREIEDRLKEINETEENLGKFKLLNGGKKPERILKKERDYEEYVQDFINIELDKNETSNPLRLLKNKKEKTIITADLLEQLLKERYPLPEWVFIPQVSNGTGTHHRRTADAIALNCYPSRGMELHGFEIKVTKQDWISELRNPKKSVAVQQYCDRWWLVISKSEFVEQGTLPSTWGMMEVIRDKKIKLNVVVQAPSLKDPCPLDRPFVASVLRNASEIVTPQAKLNEAYTKGYDHGKECLDKFSKDEIKNLESQLNNLRNLIKEFQEKSGIHINKWNAGSIGEAVNILMRYKYPSSFIENQRDILEKTLNKFNEAINELKAIEEKRD